MLQEDTPNTSGLPTTNGASSEPQALNAGSTGGSPEGTTIGHSALLAALADPLFADTSASSVGAGAQPRLPDTLSGSSSMGTLPGSNPASVDGGTNNSAAAAAAAGQNTWSSMDGIPRSASYNWQPSPSDGILQSTQPFLSAQQQAPAGGGPPRSLSQSLDGGFPRAGSLPPLNTGINGAGQPGIGAQHSRSNSLPQGLPNGFNQAALGALTPAQQQLLQQQLLLQQQQQQKMGAMQNGFNGINAGVGQNQGLAGLQAAAAAQAALQQQALLRQQQQQRQQQQAQQNNLLLQQALLAQSAGGNNAALLNALNVQQRGIGGAGGLGNGLQQQQQQGMRQGAGAPGGLNQAAINALLSAQLSGNANNAAIQQALQAQQQQNNLNAQQQLLMAQLRANGNNLNGMNGAGRGGIGMQQQQQQRPVGQLQSEALIAMQRQQAGIGAGAAGMNRLGSGALNGMGPGGMLSPDQLAAMAQLGLLNKPAGAGGLGGLNNAAGGGALNAQQQAALLNALQGGNALRAPPQQFQQRLPQQQQQFGLPQQPSQSNQRPLAPPQLDATQQSLLAAALAHHQQQNHHQMRPAPQAPRPNLNPGNLAGIGALGNVGGNNNAGGAAAAAADPIQTLQDIGRTLAQLGITVEAAVNAGLLGGLSASDVRIVAEAHRQDMENRGGGGGGGNGNAPRGGQMNPSGGPSPFLSGGGMNLQQPNNMGLGTNATQAFAAQLGGGANRVTYQHNSMGGGIGINMSSSSNASSAFASGGNGANSAPNPSSPAGSVGGASVASAPARPEATVTSSIAGDEDEVDQLLSEIDEESNGGINRKGAVPIDEAAIKAKVEEMAKEFDATQYGFFGNSSSIMSAEGSDAGDAAALLTALETAASAGRDGLPDSLLPDDLAEKLTLNDPIAHHPQQQQQHQQRGGAGNDQAASLWGSSAAPTQDGNGGAGDPFGSYLAGLRLGTGF
jgi:hypothetical protein